MRTTRRFVPSGKSLALVLSAVASLALLMMLVLGRDSDVQAQTPATATPETTRGPGVFGSVQDLPPIEGERVPSMYPNMDSNLNRIVEQVQTGQFTAHAAAASAPIHLEESVAVTIYITEGYADAISTYLTENGASPRNIGIDYVEAYVPVSLLPDASEQEGVLTIQTIIPPQPAQGTVVSEGVAVHGVPGWHRAGYRGQGVKIGVIDIGFQDFRRLMGTELPSRVEARCYTEVGVYTINLTGCDNLNTHSHGTAVTEILFDIAPDATYYIARTNSMGDLIAVVNWMVANDVDIINRSLGSTWQGPGDGTSLFSDSHFVAVNYAVAGGITFVNGAGNYAKKSWFGKFSDTDNDAYLNFSGADECNSEMVETGPGDNFSAQIRWDDKWGGATKDLDLHLYWSHAAGRRPASHVASSEDVQSGGMSHIPREFLSFVSPSHGSYCLAVRHINGSEPLWIQIQTWDGQELEYQSPYNSITGIIESTNPGMIAVGAAPWNDTFSIESFSSQGPTMGGGIKPDIVGADGGQSATYGHWGGTSQASPHVAGLAALVKQRFPHYSPTQIASYLKNHAERRGAVPNNIWGYGFARLPNLNSGPPPPPPPPNPTPTSTFTPSPTPTATPTPIVTVTITPSPIATSTSTPPVDSCVKTVSVNGQLNDSWDSDCPSESKDGSYARYYTFSLADSSAMTFRMESAIDTYLYILEGAGRDGRVLHENDDIVSGNTNSLIQETLSAGAYTIEATTYEAGATGDFTMAVSGLAAARDPTPTPEPTATPAPGAQSALEKYGCTADDLEGLTGYIVQSVAEPVITGNPEQYGIAETYSITWASEDGRTQIDCRAVRYDSQKSARWAGMNYSTALQLLSGSIDVVDHTQVFMSPIGDESMAYRLNYHQNNELHSLVAVKFLDAANLVVVQVTQRYIGRDEYTSTEEPEGVVRRIWEKVAE